MSIDQKIYIKIVVIFLGAIALTFFVLPNLMQKTERAVLELNSKKNVLRSLESKKEYLKNLNTEYSDIKPNIEALNDSFLSYDRTIEFIEIMESIADQTNNEETITIVSSARGDDQAESFNFRVSLIGSFSNLIEFLAMIENGQYQSVVSDLRIDHAGEGVVSDLEGEVANNINSTFTVTLYTK